MDFHVTFTLLLLGSIACLAPASNAAEEAVAPTERIPLFDGKSLEGLYPWFQESRRSDLKEVFSVVDGQLRVSGELMGSLITEGRYRDYVLVLEFRWGDQTWGKRAELSKDAGLLLHSNGAEGGWRNLLMPHIQSQIMEGSMGDLMLLPQTEDTAKKFPVSFKTKVKVLPNVGKTWNHRGGFVWSESGDERFFDTNVATVHWKDWDPAWKDVPGFRGTVDIEAADGDWNQMVAVADGDRLVIYFNGHKVNEVYEVRPSEGKLQLESEYAEYFVRRWELHPLGTRIEWQGKPIQGTSAAR